jgi:hypothetical protein
MPKYMIVFPERPDDAPAVPPEELARKVEDLVRRSMELGQSPEVLDPELARYVILDPFDVPRAADEAASQSDATPSKPR